MRFLSHIRSFAVQILEPRSEILGGGVVRELQPLLMAQFVTGDITAAELTFAERNFHAHGRTTERDEVTLTPLLGRLSSYDTEMPANLEEYARVDRQMEGQYVPGGREKWSEGTTKRIVEEKLIERSKVGDAPFALVEEERIVPPWPLYDAFPGDAQELVEVLKVQGHNLIQALGYERQNANRADVVEILEEEIEAARERVGGPEYIPA